MKFDASDITSRFYEAAVLPHLWPEVIDELCRIVGCTDGWFYSTDNILGKWFLPARLEPVLQDFIEGGWAARDDRFARLSKRLPSAFIRDHDIFTLEEMHQSPLYRDFLIPRGMGAGVATIVQAPDAARVVFALERAANDGPISDGTLATLNGLRPHLARALALTAYTLQERARASVVALDLINVPAALVTRGKKVVESNAAFRELPQFFVSGAYGVLRLADDRADDLLQDALAAITVDQSSIVRSIPIASAEHRMSCVAHVIPLRGEARQVFAGTSALIVAAVAGAETSLPAPVLRGLYDLTAAEARLLEDIIAGKTLQQAARSAGTSYETCRSQLKSIFQKTGSRSQIELVRRLAPLTLRPTRQ